jgi:hypothetical protein
LLSPARPLVRQLVRFWEPGLEVSTAHMLCAVTVAMPNAVFVATIEPNVWRGQHLTVLAVALERQGKWELARAVVALHELLRRWLADRLDAALDAEALQTLAAVGMAADALPSGNFLLEAMPPLNEALRRLPGCSNPGCTNTSSDSEATLPLSLCSGCGTVAYCGRDCQRGHWRTGHKEACAALAAAGKEGLAPLGAA